MKSIHPPKAGSAFFRKQDWAYEEIREWIINGELPPGARVDQESLASSLGISRIPVREALARLEAEGWLAGKAHRGMTVPENSVEDAHDVYAGRIAVESTLAMAAATQEQNHDSLAGPREALQHQREMIGEVSPAEFQKLDHDFHMGIYELAGMPRTLSAAKTLYSMSERYVRLYLRERERSLISLHEHEQILEAVISSDADEANRLTRLHIAGGLKMLEQRLFATP